MFPILSVHTSIYLWHKTSGNFFQGLEEFLRDFIASAALKLFYIFRNASQKENRKIKSFLFSHKLAKIADILKMNFFESNFAKFLHSPFSCLCIFNIPSHDRVV